MTENIDAKEIAQLFSFAKQIPWCNQGQGGNISIKQGQTMFIKPTGTRLDQIHRQSDFAAVKFSQLQTDIVRLAQSQQVDTEKEKQYLEVVQNSVDSSISPLKASMESGFHVLSTSKYVVHIHSVLAMLIAEMHFNQELPSDFLSGYSIGFLKYLRPGLKLAQALSEQKAFAQQFIFLKNHGLLFHFNDLQEIKKLEELHRDMQSFLSTKISSDDFLQAQELVKGESLSGQWRYYYPDVVIMEQKQNVLFKNSFRELTLHKKETQKDLWENWQAIVLLQTLRPQMQQISENDNAEILGLPVEKLRMRQK